MPSLIPPVAVETIEPFSEREVIVALTAQLPKGCKLYHNFEYLKSSSSGGRNTGKCLQQGEIDAVILWPEKGLLVLEVKGGEIDYCADRLQWTSRNRNGLHVIKDPLAQARRNMHALISAIEGELGAQFKQSLTYGYAVVFSTCRTVGTLPHSADTAIVCDATRLSSIGRFIDGALKCWRNGKADNSKPTVTAEQIHRAMLPVFNLIPSLKSRVYSDNEQLLRLTDDQRNYFTMVKNLQRARVDGVAGSGKTLLAVEQAVRYSRAGKKTLLLCYNKSLAGWIRQSCEEQSSDNPVDVHTFHDFCARICDEAGVEFEPDNTQDFWTEKSAELLSQASQGMTPYDAIVIDEAQDFRETWWLAIEDCLKGDGNLMAFCDPQQDIYGANGLDAIEVDDRILCLPMNCRNTQSISRFCDAITQNETQSPASAPAGLPVQIKVELSDEKRLSMVEQLVEGWIKQEGLNPSQIAILSPWRKENTCLEGVNKLKAAQLTDDINEWQNNKSVLFTTVRAFKGLEADVLLLIDVPEPGKHKAFSQADYYVGCSRAKSVLHILAKEAAVEKMAQAA